MGQPERLSAEPTALASVFDVLREGVAVCEVVRDDDGAVVDYWLRQANPAYLRGLGGKSALGKRLSELRPDVSRRWFASFEPMLKSRKPTRFEYEDRAAGRWYDCFVTPISEDVMVQLYVDVTHRKQAETHLAHLFHELNHRVKNNLMMVSSMLTMQARASKQPEVRHQISEAINRIQSISEMHSILYRTGAIETVQFDLYLAELCQRLSSVGEQARVEIALSADAVSVPIDEAVQMGIIVNELITNAMKHAYPAPQQGRVIVRVEANDESIVVRVRDFGPGLPPSGPATSGVGMRLVRSLVQKEGGAIDLVSDGGLHVSVTLPSKGAVRSEGEARLL